jgi:murein DD-endopeptidase MepM/ murein hydrolase activator NlpD
LRSLLFAFAVLILHCQSPKGFAYQSNPLFGWLKTTSLERTADTNAIFKRYPDILANDFEFPVGGKYAEGYYIAQKFGVENGRFGNRFHLGEDWNFVAGGDSDYASPIYSISDGVVSLTANYGGGWGKVIRIVHKLPNSQNNSSLYLESLYAHLYTIEVEPGQIVRKGEWIGSIGDAGGKYPAHLHFELRNQKDAPLGGGYAFSLDGYIAPTKFLIQQLAKEKKITEEQFTYDRSLGITPAGP